MARIITVLELQQTVQYRLHIHPLDGLKSEVIHFNFLDIETGSTAGFDIYMYMYMCVYIYIYIVGTFNPLNPELNPICYLLALLGAHHFFHVSRIRDKSLTLRRLMSYIYIYIYGAPILDVSRSHTTTQHSR